MPAICGSLKPIRKNRGSVGYLWEAIQHAYTDADSAIKQ
jgi:hypothetical protein